MKRINIIAAVSLHNNAIGKGPDLLWRIPDDLKRFKQLTIGHPVIMGRKTFESIGKPLPERTNIVISRDESYSADGCVVAHSLDEALQKAVEKDDEIFVMGGGEIYRQSIPKADRLYLTLVDDNPDGDVFFPDYSDFKKETSREEREYNGLKYFWVTLERE